MSIAGVSWVCLEFVWGLRFAVTGYGSTGLQLRPFHMSELLHGWGAEQGHSHLCTSCKTAKECTKMGHGANSEQTGSEF